jgi:hypothetical protein
VAEIINFNRHRKSRDRAAKEARASQNRVRHGLSSVERAVAEIEDRRIRDSLDGKRLDPDKPRK